MNKNEHSGDGEYLKRGQAVAIIIGGFSALIVPAWLMLVLMVRLADMPAKVDHMEQWEHQEDVWRAQVSERLGLPQPSAQANHSRNDEPSRASGAVMADVTEPNPRLSIPHKSVE